MAFGAIPGSWQALADLRGGVAWGREGRRSRYLVNTPIHAGESPAPMGVGGLLAGVTVLCEVCMVGIEQHRRECEARWILKMPKPERKPWLDQIGKRRGAAAQRYLEEEVIRQHRMTKEERNATHTPA